MPEDTAGPVRDRSGITDAPDDDSDRRWRLIGDVALFQGKLLLDGVRDLVLSPVSIGAALFGIATSRDDPGRHFYRLMRWGRWSDHAINLFHAKGERGSESPAQDNGAQGLNVDHLAEEVERVLIERYAQSALARAAKGSIDRSLDRVTSIPAVDSDRLRMAARRIARGLERAGLVRPGDESVAPVRSGPGPADGSGTP